MAVRHRLPALAIVALLVGACASPAATTTPTVAPSSSEESPSDGPTASPEETDEPTAQPSIAADDELDMTLPSNFGSTDLAAGFTPDPFSADIVSGGSIDVSYLGADCRGYATAASDYDIEYTAGSAGLLRVYFVADEVEDTTLVINAPDGSWHCNDDAPLTIDPMIDFENPESGRYDIWVGSFEADARNAGTFFVTESESNSP